MLSSVRFGGIWNPAALQSPGNTLDTGPVLKPQEDGWPILDESQHRAAEALADRFRRQELPTVREEGEGRRMYVFTEGNADAVKDLLENDEEAKRRETEMWRMGEEARAQQAPIDEQIAELQARIDALRGQQARLQQPVIDALFALWERRRELVQQHVDAHAADVSVIGYRGSRAPFTFIPADELADQAAGTERASRWPRWLPGHR